jgi:hypothetical protein
MYYSKVSGPGKSSLIIEYVIVIINMTVYLLIAKNELNLLFHQWMFIPSLMEYGLLCIFLVVFM